MKCENLCSTGFALAPERLCGPIPSAERDDSEGSSSATQLCGQERAFAAQGPDGALRFSAQHQGLTNVGLVATSLRLAPTLWKVQVASVEPAVATVVPS